MKKILLFISLILLLRCDEQEPRTTINSTQFNLQVEGAMQGEISHLTASISISCENDRTVITFSKSIYHQTDSNDIMVGDIIIAIQPTDSTGTFSLQGIAEERQPKHIGVVAILEQMTYDQVASTYIADQHRYQMVSNGEIKITQWSTQTNGIIQGTIQATLQENGQAVSIQGNFAVKLTEDDEVCGWD
jgi:hypothetical protein